jgi:hypothetical protein
MISVSLIHVYDAASVLPNFTAVRSPEKPVPVIVTVVPPATGPEVGEIPVTSGAAIYVYRSAADVADVPPAVVTVTSTLPGIPEGGTAIISVSLIHVYDAASVLPNFTAVKSPEKPVPVIVTVVPPATGPATGEIPVMRGAGT